jgi:hypothetical protein
MCGAPGGTSRGGGEGGRLFDPDDPPHHSQLTDEQRIALFARIYDDFPGVIVCPPQPHGPGSKLMARVVFEGTDKAGVIERTLGKDARPDGSVAWTAFHDKLWIPPSQQRGGFARALDRHVARRYRELGIERINLQTEGRGNYVWAMLDYEPATGPIKTPQIATDAINRLRQWREYGILRELPAADWERIDSELGALEAALLRGEITAMRQLSQFGRSHEFKTRADLSVAYDPEDKEAMTVGRQEVTQWIGRLVLYSIERSAEKRLTSTP